MLSRLSTLFVQAFKVLQVLDRGSDVCGEN